MQLRHTLTTHLHRAHGTGLPHTASSEKAENKATDKQESFRKPKGFRTDQLFLRDINIVLTVHPRLAT